MANEAESRKAHVIRETEQNGLVVVEDEVLVTIAALAATEVEGVYSLAGNVTKDLIARQGKNALSKGVKVNVEDNEAEVYVSLNILFGYNIPEVSSKVQDRITSAIENMIGISVSDVNIKIAGVIVED